MGEKLKEANTYMSKKVFVDGLVKVLEEAFQLNEELKKSVRLSVKSQKARALSILIPRAITFLSPSSETF